MITRIEVEGYGAIHDRHAIKPLPGLNYILGINKDEPDYASSNGAGKTYFMSIPSWVFYGVTPEGRTGDSVINRFKDFCSARVDMPHMWVQRSKARGKSVFIEGSYRGTPFSGGVREMQPILNEYLGMDYEAFCNVMSITSKSKVAQFLTTQSSKRMKILEAFIDDEDFQAAGGRVQTDIAKYEKQQVQLSFLLEEIANNLPRLQEKYDSAHERLTRFEESEKDRRREVIQNIKTLKDQIMDCSKQIQSLEIPEGSFQVLEESKRKLQVELARHQAEISIGEKTLKGLKNPLQVGADCPLCGQYVNSSSETTKHQKIKELTEAIAQHTDNVHRAQSNLKTVDSKMDKLRKDKVTLQQAHSDIAYFKQQLALCQDDLQEKNTAWLEQDVLTTKEDIEKAQARHVQTQNKLGQLKIHLPFLRKLKLLFTNEVRNTLLDELRYVMQVYVNNYLKQLVGNEFKIEFPLDDDKAKFEVNLNSGGFSQPIENYSGAETWKATVALFFALRRYSIDLNVIECPWVCIDDPAGELDEKGLSQFISLLERMLDDTHTQQIFVTLPMMPEDLNGTVIQVVRENRKSTICLQKNI